MFVRVCAWSRTKANYSAWSHQAKTKEDTKYVLTRVNLDPNALLCNIMQSFKALEFGN